MSEILFVVVATPANENFHPIYVKAENEEQARQLFCEYFSIPSRYRESICRAEPIDLQDIPVGQKVLVQGLFSPIEKDIKNN
jgi:hypothetical protein